MYFIIWNIRGIGNDLSVGRAKLLIKEHRVDCIAILEPKIPNSNMDRICKKLGMEKYLANAEENPHIWIMWRGLLDFDITCQHEQQVTIKQISQSLPEFHASFIYAKCTPVERL